VDEFEGSLERSLDEDTWPLFEADHFEIEDWAANNMNWSDVQEFSFAVRSHEVTDWQEAWVNGRKEIQEMPDE
jgi:hypothetical protein